MVKRCQHTIESKQKTPHPPAPSPREFGPRLINMGSLNVRIHEERGSSFFRYFCLQKDVGSKKLQQSSFSRPLLDTPPQPPKRDRHQWADVVKNAPRRKRHHLYAQHTSLRRAASVPRNQHGRDGASVLQSSAEVLRCQLPVFKALSKHASRHNNRQILIRRRNI